MAAERQQGEGPVFPTVEGATDEKQRGFWGRDVGAHTHTNKHKHTHADAESHECIHIYAYTRVMMQNERNKKRRVIAEEIKPNGKRNWEENRERKG